MAPAMTNDASTLPQPSTVQASVLHGPRDLRLEERPLDPPGPGEVQVAIQATGICGSDVAYYTKFANGDLCACMPLSLGHESAGVVVAVGPAGAGETAAGPLRIGDRVALEVGVPCGGACALCRRGRYNLCPRMRFRSSAQSVPHYQGTLQQRINHPAAWCHRLPDGVSYAAAALLEPLSVALHAVNRAGGSSRHSFPIGSTALVIGAGTVGLLTAAVARRAGCTTVMITDVDAGRVQYALARGFATHGHVVPGKAGAGAAEVTTASTATTPPASLFSPPASGTSTPCAFTSGTTTPASVVSSVSSVASVASVASVSSVSSAASTAPTAPTTTPRFDAAQRLAAELQALTNPVDSDDSDPGFDVTFECTGKETCMHTGLYATKAGGTLVMVGMGTPVQTLPVSVAQRREIDLVGVFRYANTYAAGIRLLCTEGPLPPLDLDDMVTHRFKGLGAAKDAFELAGRTRDDAGMPVIKVVIEAD